MTYLYSVDPISFMVKLLMGKVPTFVFLGFFTKFHPILLDHVGTCCFYIDLQRIKNYIPKIPVMYEKPC